MTISATMPMTSNSEKPMSNIARDEKGARAGASAGPAAASGLLLGLAAHLAFHGLARHLRGGRGSRFVGAFAHPILGAAHRAAALGADRAQLLRAKDQHHAHQNAQPG